MDINPVILSRLQFAWVIGWHILLPAFTVGLASFIAVLEGLRLATGRDVYIRVWNPSLKMPVRKVFYRNAPANSPRLPFEADVPIWPGNNLVTVSARDVHGTEATRAVVVFRRGD